MQILITNDDGIEAPGILELARAFSDLGKVTILAPDYEQSGVGHALTFLSPLFVRELPAIENMRRLTVNGTPSDCVRLGVSEFFDSPPDLVLSGINGGLNVGINSIYSGTVAGAREAALLNVPGFAISLEVIQRGQSNQDHIDCVAELCRGMVAHVLADLQNRPGSDTEDRKGPFFNINFPIESIEDSLSGEAPSIEWVPMETEAFRYGFAKGTDPYGRSYFWTQYNPEETGLARSDFLSTRNGSISVTPMTIDQSDPGWLGWFDQKFREGQQGE